MSNPTDNAQELEANVLEIIESHFRPTDNSLMPLNATKRIVNLIRTEKLKLLEEVMHQSTINLKSAKAVAGWAELRKEQLEAEL